MANPVANVTHDGYQQAQIWATQNLSAGVDSESLVAGLMKQGWPEYDARMVLDTAMNAPTPPATSMVPRQGKPAVMNYASPRSANQNINSSAVKDAHRQRMVRGAIWFGIGVVITVVSLGAALSSKGGGSYLVCYGPIIFGGYRMVSGFVGYISN